MTDKYNVDRRDFVKVVGTFIGGVMGVVIGLPAISYLISPGLKVQKSEAWIPAGPVDSYETGVPTLFTFTRTKVNGWERTANSYGAFIVRGEGDEFTVFSNRCTHLSCRVNWKEDLEEYICPCHDGHFDAQGDVVAGPPPKPLEQLANKVEEGVLYIQVKEG